VKPETTRHHVTTEDDMPNHEVAIQLAEDAAAEVLKEEISYEADKELCRRAYDLVDSIAAEQGFVQEGIAWDRLRECRARRLGDRQARYYGPSETVDLIADPQEQRIATLYGMCSGEPRDLVDMISLIYSQDPVAEIHLPRLRESQARIAHAWYGEE
jgi:hypothetical protein